MEELAEPVEAARATISRIKYQTFITSGNHTLIADEPETLEGGDTGMNPYALLLASLGSCTSITLRMYIDRKMWAVEKITVDLELYKLNDKTLIQVKLDFEGDLVPDQIKRLLQIAEKCPIHKILTGTVEIETAVM